MKKYFLTIVFLLGVANALFFLLPAKAAYASGTGSFNSQINYQGRLTTTAGVAVPNGSYNVQFNLYTVPTGGSSIWTETDCYSPDNGVTCNDSGNDQRVTVNNGLFSVMLGSTTPFTGVNFNQTLYLGVNIGGSGNTPTYDGEMSPRKILGAVPAAMYAGTSTVALSLNGVSSGQFFRSDSINSTSSATTSLSVTQLGSGKIAEFFGSSSQSVLSLLSNGNVGIGSSTPGSLLTAMGNVYFGGTMTVTGNAMISGISTLATTTVTSLSVGTLSGVLFGTNGVVSALATSSLGLASSATVSALTASLLNSYVARWNGTTFVDSLLIDNGTVTGINATTSTSTFNIQGTSGINPFSISSSSGASLFTVLSNGNIGLGTTSPAGQLTLEKDAIGATAVDGLVFNNATAATGTINQNPADIRFSGFGLYGTTSQEVDAIEQLQPLAKVGGGLSTAGFKFNLSEQVNHGGYGSFFSFLDQGNGSPLNGNDGFYLDNPTTAQTAMVHIGGYSIADGSGLAISNRFSIIQNGSQLQFNALNTGVGQASQSFNFQGGTPDTTHQGSLFAISGIYNNPGQKIDGLLLNITNSSSSATSTLENLEVGGVSKFAVGIGGNVGIGSSSPGSILSIQGTSTSAATPLFNVASSSGVSIFTILSNGNVGIATTTPATTLDVHGNITDESVQACDSSSQAIGTNAAGQLVCDTSLSDERLKNDITSLDGQGALALIDSLNPVSFYWKDPSIPGTGSTQEQFGFIAQQVAEVAPNLVATTSATYLTPDQTYYLDYQGIIAPLVKAVQQQQIEINLFNSSTSAVVTASSSSFIENIADAVVNVLQSGGDWVLSKLSATEIVSNDIQTQTIETQSLTTQTASVVDGIEMTDHATGYIYCIQLVDGEFSKTLGTCTSASSTTPTLISINTNTNENINENINASTTVGIGASTPIDAATSTISLASTTVVSLDGSQVDSSGASSSDAGSLSAASSSVSSQPLLASSTVITGTTVTTTTLDTSTSNPSSAPPAVSSDVTDMADEGSSSSQ